MFDDMPTRHLVVLAICLLNAVLGFALCASHIDFGEWQPVVVAIASTNVATGPALCLYAMFAFIGQPYSWEN
jgi:hypothetical protein